MPEGVGHWCAFIAGPSTGWDRTLLGLALYDDQGTLTFADWVGLEKAERRGDWEPTYARVGFEPPATWEEMTKTLGRTGNAMSTIRWVEAGVTLAWDEAWAQTFYDNMMGLKEAPTTAQPVGRHEGGARQ